jgi:protoheme IX farnesyltransferase
MVKTPLSPMIKKYYALTKPGIIYGNVMTAAAGFLMASALHEQFDVWLLLALLTGTALVIASGCVFNNYIDRGIDAKMARTKKRALVTKMVSSRDALVYGTILNLTGFLLLVLFTNWPTVLVGVIGFIDYIVLYSWTKRHSTLSTIVGSVSGATSLVAGYTAVVNGFDSAALLLFLIMVFWQMPHFYAIAIFRYKDYSAASLPVLPVKLGVRTATVHIVLYMLAFLAAITLLTLFNYTGYVFLIVMAGLSLAWLRLGLKGFRTTDSVAWARGLFLFSLIVLLGLSCMLPIGALLP